MGNLINRQDAITVCNSAIDLWEGQLGVGALVAVRDKISELPSAQPVGYVHIDDVYRLISGHSNYHGDNILAALTCLAEGKEVLKPIAVLDTQPDNRLTEIADLVEGTIDHFNLEDAMDLLYQIKDVLDGSDELPSAQPKRTCVNCGRTANNGGWYADGGTRCPIEEHYALPKDGYCHLWEKRNVTDDDYPERREE